VIAAARRPGLREALYGVDPADPVLLLLAATALALVAASPVRCRRCAPAAWTRCRLCARNERAFP